MIRALEERDWDAVCALVNENWKNVYQNYVNPELLSDTGCAERARQLKQDFAKKRLSEFVFEERGEIAGMLSFGSTADQDLPGAFELWRIYVAPGFQGKGVGGKLFDFAEEQARAGGYEKIVIWAFRENSHALAFYQRRGYTVDREEYLGEPYQAVGVRLRKDLPAAE